jgi:hypothetical protein
VAFSVFLLIIFCTRLTWAIRREVGISTSRAWCIIYDMASVSCVTTLIQAHTKPFPSSADTIPVTNNLHILKYAKRCEIQVCYWGVHDIVPTWDFPPLQQSCSNLASSSNAWTQHLQVDLELAPSCWRRAVPENHNLAPYSASLFCLVELLPFCTLLGVSGSVSPLLQFALLSLRHGPGA